MSTESLQLIESRLARLRNEHVNRILVVGRAPLGMFSPTKKATFGQSVEAYAEAATAELVNYIGLVRAEVLALTEQLLLPLSSEAMADVLAATARQFDPDLYPKRLKLFEEAVIREGGRCGVRVSEWGARTDLVAAQHHVGTTNQIRQSLAAIRDDLELLRLRPRPVTPPAITQYDTKLGQANRIVKLEPNFFGIGINFNYLIGKWLGKK